MENTSQPYYPQDQFHSQNVAHTLAELEKAVQQHEATLSQVRHELSGNACLTNRQIAQARCCATSVPI